VEEKGRNDDQTKLQKTVTSQKTVLGLKKREEERGVRRAKGSKGRGGTMVSLQQPQRRKIGIRGGLLENQSRGGNEFGRRENLVKRFG